MSAVSATEHRDIFGMRGGVVVMNRQWDVVFNDVLTLCIKDEQPSIRQSILQGEISAEIPRTGRAGQDTFLSRINPSVAPSFTVCR